MSIEAKLPSAELKKLITQMADDELIMYDNGGNLTPLQAEICDKIVFTNKGTVLLCILKSKGI